MAKTKPPTGKKGVSGTKKPPARKTTAAAKAPRKTAAAAKPAGKKTAAAGKSAPPKSSPASPKALESVQGGKRSNANVRLAAPQSSGFVAAPRLLPADMLAERASELSGKYVYC